MRYSQLKDGGERRQTLKLMFGEYDVQMGSEQIWLRIVFNSCFWYKWC